MQTSNLKGALVTMVLAGTITVGVGFIVGLLDNLLFWLVLGLVLAGGFRLGERRH